MPTLKWITEHMDTIRIGDEEIVCVNCKHFVRHYVQTGSYTFMPIWSGHCTGSRRLKDRTAGDKCPGFEKLEV